MEERKRYSTIVLSDIHIGSEYSKIKEVTNFLRSVNCDRLILNGDIIDGWQLQKSAKHWASEQTGFFKVLMKMMEKQHTKIIYVRGNHDDFLDKLIPFRFSDLKIVKDYTFNAFGKSYFVCHGDIFDTITTNMRWLSKLGDWGYSLLLWINKHYNRIRLKHGKSYYSLSQKIKGKVKSAVSYISDFEENLVEIANVRHVDGIICGHIHQAANKFYGQTHYLNSGDWVESMTALTLSDDGVWEVIEYNEDFEKLNHSFSINKIAV